MHKGFADLSLTTWVRRLEENVEKNPDPAIRVSSRAGHGIRTRDFDLGKVALYH
jgi:hypothetical protein